MRQLPIGYASVLALAAATAAAVQAQTRNFNRVASFPVALNLADGAVLAQLLPSGVSPEGATAIPVRNLLVTANEVDLVERRPRPRSCHAQRAPGRPRGLPYAHRGRPAIGWGALSGLAADRATPGRLFAVSDSVYGMAPTIFEIDATAAPARIVAAIPVTREGRPAQKLDIEGIAPGGEGGFWLASEGRADRLIPHALYRVDADGAIADEIPFPAEALAHETRFGAEGVAVAGGKVWIAIRREWGDDPEGERKLLAYDLEAESWGEVRYLLDAAPEGGWMGLSEIAAAGGAVYLVERDNQIGANAKVKQPA